MSESTKDNDVMKLMDSEGLLDQKYRDWCMTHPGKVDSELCVTKKIPA